MADFVGTAPTNGETLGAMFGRVHQFLDELRTLPYQRILIVTHVGAIRCCWAYFCAVPLDCLFRIPVRHGEALVARLGGTSATDTIRQKR